VQLWLIGALFTFGSFLADATYRDTLACRLFILILCLLGWPVLLGFALSDLLHDIRGLDTDG
jgi:hypothetical protein